MNPFDFEALKELVKEKKYRELKDILKEQNEVDVAAFIETLKADKATVVFRTLPKELGAEVFAYLSTDMKQHIINSITDFEISVIIEELFVDDAVDLLEELPANVVKKVLKNAKPNTRKLINQFLQYPDNSAGSIMTAEFVDLKKAMTVYDAIAYIRKISLDKETVYTCYVTNANRFLEGVVTVKDLFLAKDADIIGDIMDTNVLFAHTVDDRETVANLFAKYDFLSIPVVDHENRLVGIVTVDDAVEVIEQEATEDFEKMAAMLPSERPYLKTSVFSLAKNRIAWLLILMVSAMVTGGILSRYEHAFSTVPLLVTFIPMLTDTGGNAGAQSSTMIIRGMALSEIHSKDFLKVVWKELRVSLLVGIALSAANYIRLIITNPADKNIALTVSLSLFVTVILAKTIGGILPMFAKLIKADPAIMAAPLITTIVDALSLIVYFTFAQMLLSTLMH